MRNILFQRPSSRRYTSMSSRTCQTSASTQRSDSNQPKSFKILSLRIGRPGLRKLKSQSSLGVSVTESIQSGSESSKVSRAVSQIFRQKLQRRYEFKPSSGAPDVSCKAGSQSVGSAISDITTEFDCPTHSTMYLNPTTVTTMLTAAVLSVMLQDLKPFYISVFYLLCFSSPVVIYTDTPQV